MYSLKQHFSRNRSPYQVYLDILAWKSFLAFHTPSYLFKLILNPDRLESDSARPTITTALLSGWNGESAPPFVPVTLAVKLTGFSFAIAHRLPAAAEAKELRRNAWDLDLLFPSAKSFIPCASRGVSGLQDGTEIWRMRGKAPVDFYNKGATSF